MQVIQTHLACFDNGQPGGLVLATAHTLAAAARAAAGQIAAHAAAGQCCLAVALNTSERQRLSVMQAPEVVVLQKQFCQINKAPCKPHMCSALLFWRFELLTPTLSDPNRRPIVTLSVNLLVKSLWTPVFIGT